MNEIKKYSKGGLGCAKITPVTESAYSFQFEVCSESHSVKRFRLNGAEVEALLCALMELEKNGY